MSTNPRFITLEGGEGAGKSTQAKRLVARLSALGHKVVLTREPGGAPGAEQIRELLVTGEANRWTPISEALLNYAARQEHLERTIRPALTRGAWVISDRFADSTRAYQGVAQGLGLEAVEALDRIVVGNTQPDLTLIFDMPVEIGLARATTGASGKETRYESLGLSFHEKLRVAFKDIAAAHLDRCAIIDASGDMDAVEAAIWDTVQDKLGPLR